MKKIAFYSLLALCAQGLHAKTNQTAVGDTTKVVEIDEVVVTGVRDKIDVRHLPLSLSVVKKIQIEKRNEPSILPILTEQVPGFFNTARGVMGFGVSTGGSGNIKMRGIGNAPTTGMLVIIDGHPQYMGLMGHHIADAYQSMMVERVEVVRGPASVLYGSNAMGGVINILTNKNKEDGFKNKIRAGYGSYNTLTSELNSRFRKKKFSAELTASYNRTDGHREDMGFEQYGGYAKLGYDFSKHWSLFADVNLTHYNASNPGTTDRPIFDNDSRITRGMSSFSLENNYEHTSGALKGFYNWGHHNINDGYYAGKQPKDFLFNSDDMMIGINWYQSASFFEGNRLTAGIDFQRFGGKAWNDYLNGTEKQLVDKHENDIAGYVDIRQSFGNFLTVNAGIRADHHTVSGTHFIPQFGASIYPIANGELKLIASKGFRNPTIKEMYMFPPQNPDLKPEELWSHEVAWRHRLLENRLSYEVALFYIKGKNMIQTVPVDGRMLNINTGEVENWGAEWSGSYKVSERVSVSANYSFLHMEHLVLAAPEHKGYAGVDYNKGRWFASTGLMYVDGLYTSITKDKTTQENYLAWNANLGFKINKNVDLYVKGENLLNQKYEINKGFPMPGATVMGGASVSF